MKNKDIENQHVGSSSEVTRMKNKDIKIPHFGSSSEDTSEWCIYKVPERLRKLNEAVYTPQVVSIGPFHHKNTRFWSMENKKLSYLRHFLDRAAENERRKEDFVNYIENHKERIRRCYAEPIELSSDKFVEMILLDGCFIIEYLLRTCVRRMVDDDVVYGVLHKPWLENDIYHDLILLENQLPFFLLEGLYNLAFPDNPISGSHLSFVKLTSNYFNFSRYTEPEKPLPQGDVIKHFTDLLRTILSPISERPQPKGNKKNRIPYSAMELQEAGVRFMVSPSRCLFDMNFTNEVLQIPYFEIDDKAESLIKNLMALEQCHYPRNTYICDYILMMDTLINTAKDVEILDQSGIIFNRLGGGNDAVAGFFNNVDRGIEHNLDRSYFCRLSEDLTEYCGKPWNTYKEILKREHLSTPWKIASTVAAVLLLVLTFLQTVNSFRSRLG